MARAEFKMPDDFLSKISRLGDQTDSIVEKALKAGGEVVADQVRSSLHSVLSENSSGELERSLGVSPAKLDRNGNPNVKVGFDEPRRGGESNAKIASILEYGKSGQPPRPFLKPAKTQSRNACIEKMKAVLDEETENI